MTALHTRTEKADAYALARRLLGYRRQMMLAEGETLYRERGPATAIGFAEGVRWATQQLRDAEGTHRLLAERARGADR